MSYTLGGLLDFEQEGAQHWGLGSGRGEILTKLLLLFCVVGLFAEQASADIQSYLERNPFPGAVLVVKKGALVYSQDDLHLAYQIGSISKVFDTRALHFSAGSEYRYSKRSQAGPTRSFSRTKFSRRWA